MTWIDVEEYMNTKPDAIAMNDVQKNLKVSFEETENYQISTYSKNH